MNVITEQSGYMIVQQCDNFLGGRTFLRLPNGKPINDGTKQNSKPKGPQQMMFDYADERGWELFIGIEYVSRRYMYGCFETLSSDIENSQDGLNNNMHAYEMIRETSRCKLYFDLDSTTYFDINEAIAFLTNHYKVFFNNTSCSADQIFVSDACGPKDDSYKYSYHIVFDNGFCFENNRDIKHFIEFLKKESPDDVKKYGIDTSVYSRNRMMKLINQSKLGSDRVQKPISGSFKNHLCGVYKHDTHLDVYQFTRSSKTYEDVFVDVGDIDADMVALNDDQNFETVQGLLNIFKNGDDITYETYLKVACICKQEDIPFCVFYKWVQGYDGCDYDKELALYKSLQKRSSGEFSPTIKTLRKMVIAKYPKLYESFSDRIVRETTTVTLDLSKHNYDKTSYDARYCESLVEPMKTYDCVILKSHLGTGKSTVIRDLLKHSAYESVLCITPRIMFAESIYTDLKETDSRFVLYSNVKPIDRFDEKFIVCQLESLHTLDCEFKFDLIIMDECESNLLQFSSNTMTSFDEIARSFERLMTQCRQTIWCDAFVLDRSIHILNELRPEKKLFIENTHNPYKRIAFEVGKDGSKMVEFINNFVEQRPLDRNIICTGSASNSESIYCCLDKDSTLLINSSTSDLLKKQIKNVNSFWREYQHVIYTTSITVGVSYDDEKHFDNLFLHLSCNSSCVRDIFQGSLRARNISNNMMYYSRHSRYLGTDRLFEFDRDHLLDIISVRDLRATLKPWMRWLFVFNEQEKNASAYFHKKMIDTYLDLCGYVKTDVCEIDRTEPIDVISNEHLRYDDIDDIDNIEFRRIDNLLKSGQATSSHKHQFMKHYFCNYVIQKACVIDIETKKDMFEVYAQNKNHITKVLSNLNFERRKNRDVDACQDKSVFLDNQEQRYKRIDDLKRILELNDRSHVSKERIPKALLKQARSYLLKHMNELKNEFTLDMRKNNIDEVNVDKNQDKSTVCLLKQLFKQWNFHQFKNNKGSPKLFIDYTVEESFELINEYCVRKDKSLFRD
tara:strand:- start:3796 stop:6840 length:3045 start_codon:yes stop_codon:yes gene_type:complete